MTGKRESLEAIAGPVSRETFLRLVEYEQNVLRWGRGLNLVAPSQFDRLWDRHILDSAQLLPLLGDATHVADLGSGAGFPGAVLAILLHDRPGAHVDLIESNGKKAAFLREASDFCGNVRVRCVRAESWKEQVDAVISRAVRPADIIAIARRTAGWYGILLSRPDGEKFASRGKGQVTPLPWDAESAILTCDVPRET